MLCVRFAEEAEAKFARWVEEEEEKGEGGVVHTAALKAESTAEIVCVCNWVVRGIKNSTAEQRGRWIA